MTIKTLTIISVLFCTLGCERVTEYKCNDAQIEAARKQFQFCKEGNADFTKSCWEEATRAHCDMLREYHRTGKEM